MNQFARFQNMLKKEQDGHLLSQLKDEFAEKPFYEEYKNTYQASKIGVYLFHLISLLSGSYFLYYVLYASTGLMVPSACLAVACLGVMEYSKHEVLPKWAKSWMAGKRKVKAHFQVFNLLLIALSVFMSVEGAKQLLNDAYPQPKLLSIRPIEQEYQAEKQRLTAEIKEIEKGNTYKKRVAWQYRSYHPSDYVLSDKGKELVLSLDQAIKELEVKKVVDKEKIEFKNAKSIALHENRMQKMSFSIIAISLLNETLCLLALFFGVFYRYRAYKELCFISNDGSEKLVVSQENPERKISSSNEVFAVQSPLNKDLSEPPIGFQMNIKSVEVEQVKRRDYLEKWSRVVDEIERGTSINQIVKKFEGQVSRSTVMNVKRVWRHSLGLS